MILTSSDTTDRRRTFFKFVFAQTEGWLCLSRREVSNKTWTDEYFHWPEQEDDFMNAINRDVHTCDLWYSPMLFSKAQRRKENVSFVPCAYSDLDDCDPSLLLMKPTLTTETSPGRFQALWVFGEGDVEPFKAEAISKRIAYYHEQEGADISGWDLTQLLRIPYSYNYKRNSVSGAPIVRISGAESITYTIADFDLYPKISEDETALSIPFPDPKSIEMDANDVLMEHRRDLHPMVWTLFQQAPTTDWSKSLWQLYMLCLEAGLSKEETYVVARAAACNKYDRDQRSERLLWRDLVRAAGKVAERNSVVLSPSMQHYELLTPDERQWVIENPSIIERYVEWGKDMGDAAWRYHQAGAFVALSSLLAGAVRLPTSYGTIIPNLWFMILADTTITRKTTAMDMAMDIIMEIDSDAVLATDGSIEGLFTSLSMRPGRPSIFLRDEFSGLLEMISKKDYYAGMAETLTKLYDGKFQKRVLRKETIEVREPVLILFAGGIKNRILQLLNAEHVSSGFLPRFIFVSAESDVTTLKPLGPPTASSTGRRSAIVQEFRDLHNHYRSQVKIMVEGREMVSDKIWEAELTPEAWTRYNKFESDLLNNSLEAIQKDLVTPTYDRLSKSGLKAAVLLAAARKRGEKVVVEEQDLVRAFAYVEQWRLDTVAVLTNIGKSAIEKQLAQVLVAITNNPGISRSEIMRNYHLTSRDLNIIFDTLELRDNISRQKAGRGEKLYPTDLSKTPTTKKGTP